MTTVLRQKISAIIRKDYKGDKVFTVREFGYRTGNVKVSVEVGKFRNPQTEYQKLLELGSKIVRLGGNVRVYKSDYGVDLIVDNIGTNTHYPKFNENTFLSVECKEIISKITEYRQQEAKKAEERTRAYEEAQRAKLNKAIALNPNVTFEILEGNENEGIGFTTMKGGKFHQLHSF